MNKQNIIGVIALIALVVGGLAFLKAPSAASYGAATSPTPGNITYPTGRILPNPSTFDFVDVRQAAELDGPIMLGGFTAATAEAEAVTIGSCATGTSTPFDVANPFSATSTASIDALTGFGQATSTSLYVGTTTQASGLASTNVSASLLNGAVISTSTQFSAISGITTQLGSGQISAGSGTIGKIIVGPNERIGAFATSTYGTTGAINYSPALTSCTYKIFWKS